MRKLLSLLLLLASSTLFAAESSPHGVVLMYHRFGEPASPSTNVSVEQFKVHLDYLQQSGFHIWPLRKLITTIFNHGEVPDKTVALTVDDAYLSVYRNAFPVLKERGIPLTVFVSTDPVDRGQLGYMSWRQIREMQSYGIDFANHSSTHNHLAERLAGETPTEWRRRVEGDIETAQRRLDEKLGREEIRLFAYPFGEFSQELEAITRELGYYAFGQHSGAIGVFNRKQALPRFPINTQFGALDKFALKVATLPLPVIQQQPVESLLETENPPTLTLQLANRDKPASDAIHCYLGNGTPLLVERGENRVITVRAASPLRQGRSRYNCTAPAGGGRFYWFSHPWINGPDAKDPVR